MTDSSHEQQTDLQFGHQRTDLRLFKQKETSVQDCEGVREVVEGVVVVFVERPEILQERDQFRPVQG